MSELFAPTINLLILVGILAYYLRTPVKQSVQDRHTGLRDELARVRDLLRQAQDQYNEFSSKLKAIEAETTALRQQAVQDAEAAKHRIINDAQRMANAIASDSRRAAESLYGELKSQLASELGGRVLDRAEAILRERLTGDDRARIRKEFSTQVETVQ
jgi:F0F1-type ATP synthase membrane subunit b/b'